MKIFQISSNFILKKKPEWLDGFRKKFDEPYPYHITLRISTYLKKEDINSLKDDIREVIEGHEPMKVVFDRVEYGRSEKGERIMIMAQANEALTRLHDEISGKVSKYGKHIKKEYREFEDNYEPHVTIARHMSKSKLKEAKKELKDIKCEAMVKRIMLAVVDKDDFFEWTSIGNRSYFELKKNEEGED